MTARPFSPGRMRELYRDGVERAALPTPGIICALPIPGSEANRLGRDANGSTCIVLAVPASSKAARPDVRLRNLQVQRRVVCDVTHPAGQREVISGVVIRCYTESSDLRSFFLDLFDQALGDLGPSPSEQDVDAWIDHATQLFAELDDPTTREIRGLWGELLVIRESRDPAVLLRRWHEDPEDRFDFTAGAFALEVKTCRDLERIHVFSLAQLRPPTEMDVVIASVPIRADPMGITAVDLLSEIEARVEEHALREKLRLTAFRIGGSSLAQSPKRFDRKSAVAGLRLFRAKRVPAFDQTPPAEILRVELTIRCRDILTEDLNSVVINRLRE